MHAQPVYTAIVKQMDDAWIGWIEEVAGVNSQGETKEELLRNLRSALAEAISFNRQDARDAAMEDFVEERIAL
jgi:predicted RNase H-like HicB family nuclease